ncbi:undecaprenyl-diphosphatase [Agrobacterium vitis]|nr:undecaprenyl-diphosphatase [Agrobacterium vitis]MBE1438860.1 undecaprenyl-diphosphatase [Agrobacterium vitis]
MSAIFARLRKPQRCHCLAYWPMMSNFLACFSLVMLAAVVFDGASGHTGRLSNPVLLAVASTLTRFGESDWCLVISFILTLEGTVSAHLASTARRRCHAIFISSIGVYAFLSIALSGLAANLLKKAIGRARPEQFLQTGAFDFLPFAGSARFESFPSGHSTTVGAVFMIAALICPRYRLPFLIAALWLGMTRVLVGAHYPSDVIAGLCFGAGFTWIMARLFARHGLVFLLDQHGKLVLRQPLKKTGYQTTMRRNMPQENRRMDADLSMPALCPRSEPA